MPDLINLDSNLRAITVTLYGCIRGTSCKYSSVANLSTLTNHSRISFDMLIGKRLAATDYFWGLRCHAEPISVRHRLAIMPILIDWCHEPKIIKIDRKQYTQQKCYVACNTSPERDSDVLKCSEDVLAFAGNTFHDLSIKTCERLHIQFSAHLAQNVFRSLAI